jgi:hypothetical protein
MSVTYLSTNSTPYQNFCNIVEKHAIETEEYSLALDKLNNQDFPAKLNALKISSLAFFLLSGLSYLTHRTTLGIVFSSVTVVTLVGLKYHLDRQARFSEEVKKKAEIVDQIFSAIFEFLSLQMQFKENELIYKTNSKEHVSHGVAGDFFKKVLNEYDQKGSSTPQQGYEDYPQLRVLAQKILTRQSSALVSKENWEKLRMGCAFLLYGRRGASYDQLLRPPFLRIHPDADYVKLYESDTRERISHQKLWKAAPAT